MKKLKNYCELNNESIKKIFDSYTIELLPLIPWSYGNMQIEEILLISQIADYFSVKNIFEFGTFNGRTTYYLSTLIGSTKKIYTLDLPKDYTMGTVRTKYELDPEDSKFINYNNVGSLFKGSKASSKISQLWGDSAVFDYSKFKNLINMVIIDASHSYKYIENDTINAEILLHPNGGVIVWHDYKNIFPGVNNFINELIHLKKETYFFHIEKTNLIFGFYGEYSIIIQDKLK